MTNVIGILILFALAWVTGLIRLPEAISPSIEEIPYEISANGFTPVAMPDGAIDNEVLIYTPIHCTAIEVKLGADLETALTRAGIPTRRVDNFSIRMENGDKAKKVAIDRTTKVLDEGTPPIAFINGYAKAQPTVAEVISEYRRTRI